MRKMLTVVLVIITVISTSLTTKLFAEELENKEVVEATTWFNNQVKLKNNSSDTLNVKVVVNSKARRNQKGFYRQVKLNPKSTKVINGYSFTGTGGTVLGTKKISSLEVIICE